MNTRQAARKMLAYMEAVCVPEHDYASVRETDFAHLDLNFYRSTRAALEAERFIYLEDCEDRTLTAAPGNVLMPVMIRVMTSSDGSIVAGIYHARIRAFWLRLLLGLKRKLPGRNVSLETEFQDGSFVSTNNSTPAQLVSLPPEIDCEYLPSGTPVTRLLERHRQRIAAKQAQTGLPVRPASSLADARAAQRRIDGLTAAYRRAIGGVSGEELARFAGSHTALARELHIELQLQSRTTLAASQPGSHPVAAPQSAEASAQSIMTDASPETTPPSASAALSPDDALLAEIAAKGESSGSSSSSGPLLMLTAVLFVALGGFSWGWQTVIFLALAIGFHESGHVLAMRIFGYKNVRMLFLPFFGGLATGEPRELDASKNALVALAGPAFGLATAALAGLFAWISDGPVWLVEFAWVSLVLNAFNLLPIMPLDGGQFTNDTLFSRFPVLELVFRLLAIVALGGLAVTGQMWLLGVVAFFMLLSTPLAFRRARLIRDARRNPTWQTRPLDREAVASLREMVTRIHHGIAPEKLAAKLPEHVHGVWLEIRKRFPGPGRTVALLAGYLAVCVILIPILAVLFVGLLPRPGT